MNSSGSFPHPSSQLLFFLLLSSFGWQILSSPLPLPSLPLSTDTRWIVDMDGLRVKLACVNWAAHMETMLAEGLSKQPLDVISSHVARMGFNCVRLTWALYMLTDNTSSLLTVRQSLLRVGLVESVDAVRINNPALIDLTVVQAFQAVVRSLERNNVMVILDNQISLPGWCCSYNDGNGFFGDEFFDPGEWTRGLAQMASLFSGSINVVGMSLRNELRGPNQNVSQWYKYMQRGAEAVHSANPNLLVIVSGLDYDKDLSYISQKQIHLTFNGKLVYEMHWYGFSDGGDWMNGNPNEVCSSVVHGFTNNGGFLLSQGWPLFLGEFGVDQSGMNIVDNRFLSCLSGFAAEMDIDWAIWALQGSYYIRDGIFGYDETYGLLSWDWSKARNSSFLHRIAALQSSFQGPGFPHNSQHKILFHPLTGLCVLKNPSFDLLFLGSCSDSEPWEFTKQQTIVLMSVQLCMQAEGLERPAKLGSYCNGSNSTWILTSVSKMHISSTLSDGTSVCLDVGFDGTIVTSLCDCLTAGNNKCDPQHQWFKIVSSSRDPVSAWPLLNHTRKGRL